MSKEKVSRRHFLQGIGAGAALAALGIRVEKTEQNTWPTEPEAILARIKELRFPLQSELRTTILPRKMIWEMAQVHKLQGTWPEGKDESDWLGHLDIFKSTLAVLATAGLRGGRLAVLPFELTTDGAEFDWHPLETAINAMQQRQIQVDLCVGPLDYPYYPGIRLPQLLTEQLQQELADTGQNHIHISLVSDPALPKSSLAIRDYTLHFLRETLKKYGHDPRIDKFYLANEWPDTHAIEGVDATVSVGEDFMLECVRLIKSFTTKPIALNTNIHPTEPEKLREKLGPLFDELGDQGVLGFDTYPSEEMKIRRLRKAISDYAELFEVLREAWPGTQFVFTEMQAEPWPPEGVEGQSWAQIFTERPELVTRYYQEMFAPTLETHIIASGIKEVGLWVAPILPVIAALGYTFPIELLKTVAETMREK